MHAATRRPLAHAGEGYPLLPLLLLGLMSSCILFGALYLGWFAGHFDPLVYNENATGKVGQLPTGPDPVKMGQRIFLTNCIQCHQVNGQGLPGTYPPLAGSDWVAGPEERIIRIVLHGASGPFTVSGQNFNNVMTPFGAMLKDEQIAHVLTYIRSAWGNTAAPVAPEKVAEIRAATAGRPATQAWTAGELLKQP